MTCQMSLKPSVRFLSPSKIAHETANLNFYNQIFWKSITDIDNTNNGLFIFHSIIHNRGYQEYSAYCN